MNKLVLKLSVTAVAANTGFQWEYDYGVCPTNEQIEKQCFFKDTYERVSNTECTNEPTLRAPSTCANVKSKACDGSKIHHRQLLKGYDMSTFSDSPLYPNAFREIKCKNGLMNDANSALRVQCKRRKIQIGVYENGKQLSVSELQQRGFSCMKTTTATTTASPEPRIANTFEKCWFAAKLIVKDLKVTADSEKEAMKKCWDMKPKNVNNYASNRMLIRESSTGGYNCYWTYGEMLQIQWLKSTGCVKKSAFWEVTL